MDNLLLSCLNGHQKMFVTNQPMAISTNEACRSGAKYTNESKRQYTNHNYMEGLSELERNRNGQNIGTYKIQS